MQVFDGLGSLYEDEVLSFDAREYAEVSSRTRDNVVEAKLSVLRLIFAEVEQTAAKVEDVRWSAGSTCFPHDV